MKMIFVEISLESTVANSFTCTLYTQNMLAPYFFEFNLLFKIHFQHLNLVTPLQLNLPVYCPLTLNVQSGVMQSQWTNISCFSAVT